LEQERTHIAEIAPLAESVRPSHYIGNAMAVLVPTIGPNRSDR
jgi:hypothetical protein